MAETALAGKSERLVSLDVFRGITIGLMVLVNNPGTWSHIYGPLKHAPWHGWTPTDFVFPFFLFIVGVAMTFSFDRRIKRGDSRLRLFEQVVRRTIIIFLLGLILGGFPNFRLIMPYILVVAGLGFLFNDEPILDIGREPRVRRNKLIAIGCFAVGVLWFLFDFRHFQSPVISFSFSSIFPLSNEVEGGKVLRVPGVLQRIAFCYFFASLIVMRTGVRGRIVWTMMLLIGYWLIMKYIDPPGGYTLGAAEDATRDAPAGVTYPGALNGWIDQALLGDHLYSRRPDPEGLLSTIPAIATTLLGILTGNWLHTNRDRIDKATGLAIAGGALVLVGQCMDIWFPINKKIWTSSYVVFMSGWALLFLAFCFYLIDAKGNKRWSTPFLVFGTNAIFVFFASGILARVFYMIQWESGGESWNVKSWVYANVFQANLDPDKLSSFAYAICYILLWLLLTYPLYRNRIFLKV